jgi:hypothetical protein
VSYRQSIYCANRNCGAECGTGHGATYNDPGYVDLDEGAVVDDRNGDVFCSRECCIQANPVYCAECGDEKVQNEGDCCTYCTIASEQGEDAAYAWYCSQHPELLRKPVVSVSATASYGSAHKKAM